MFSRTIVRYWPGEQTFDTARGCRCIALSKEQLLDRQSDSKGAGRRRKARWRQSLESGANSSVDRPLIRASSEGAARLSAIWKLSTFVRAIGLARAVADEVRSV
jgi:hypothetical protein